MKGEKGLRIACLCENTPYSDSFYFEHGLSLYIETAENKILFDMGQSDVFIKNANLLGIDLSKADTAVLSHGHYDHGGGISGFLKANASAKVYMSSGAFGEYFNASGKYIGLDPALMSSGRIVFTEDNCCLSENAELFSCNEKERIYPTDSAGLTVRLNGKFLPDGFLHEQYLRIRENGKTYLISGCSHKGVLNILNWFRPDVFVGGFHFMNRDASDDDPVLCAAAKVLRESGCTYYTCHCTGVGQYRILKSKVGENLHYLSSGQKIEI